MPPVQTSLTVAGFPSLHVVPFVFAGFVQTPVPVLHTPMSWHWSSAVQTTGFAPVQTPAWQVSVCVQELPSLQVVPFALGGFEQTPVPVLHVPTSWHWSEAVQTTGLAPAQRPAWQVSVCVQALPSVHAVPFALGGFEHTPVPVSHTPASWHWSEAVQTTGFAPVQVPAWQVSVCVQALPSVHAVPFDLGGFEQTPVPGLHVPTSWHWSSAVQVTPVQRSDPAQTPFVQTSFPVFAFPSSQGVPFSFAGFEQAPVPGSHVPTSWH